MTKIPLPLSGSCRCGRVEIRITQPPICTAACHCRGCQKMAASAFSLTAMVPEKGFAVTRGETVVGGMRAPEIAHHFCPHCMSWMFTRPAGMGFVNVRPTMLDDTGWFRPFMETYASTKLPFAQTGAPRSFATFPAMEELPELLAAYEAWAAAAG
jgi:hypothetical protein